MSPQNPQECEDLFELFTEMFKISAITGEVHKSMMDVVERQVTNLLESPLVGVTYLVLFFPL